MTEQAFKDASEITVELDKVDSLVLAAQRLVKDGRVIDLSALQQRTAVLCEAAVALPAKDGKTLLPRMTKLIENLDALTETLTDKFGHLPKQIQDARPQTAASAYERHLESKG